MVAALATLAVVVACSDGSADNARGDAPTSMQDSIATANEVRASLEGEVAPGKQAYSYRGFYAGMTRSRLEAQVRRAPGEGGVTPCQPSLKQPEELSCVYEAVVGADSTPVHLDVTYAVEGPGRSGAAGGEQDRIVREITVVRELPIDVDGVSLAKALSDAFDRQTALLDRRDASYARHQAHVQMGTVSGARPNYVEMTVMPHLGREELTVKMTRGRAPKSVSPPKSVPPAAAAPATRR
jgi:hypothetical protein